MVQVEFSCGYVADIPNLVLNQYLKFANKLANEAQVVWDEGVKQLEVSVNE